MTQWIIANENRSIFTVYIRQINSVTQGHYVAKQNTLRLRHSSAALFAVLTFFVNVRHDHLHGGGKGPLDLKLDNLSLTNVET